MNKIFHLAIEVFFWIMTVLSPLFASALLAVLSYYSFNFPFVISLILIVLGAIAGVIFAEKIRRKHGCLNYWSRIMATPDIQSDKEKK